MRPFRNAMAFLLVSSAIGLQAQGSLLASASRRLFSDSPSAKLVERDVLAACPAFTLTWNRQPIASMFRLEARGRAAYVGVINTEKIKEKGSTPEIAIAGLYFMIRSDLDRGKPKGADKMLAFMEKVRLELAKAEPERFGKVQSLTPALEGGL